MEINAKVFTFFAHKEVKPNSPLLKCGLHIVMVKATATPSSTLAWKIPWMEELSRLQSMGLLQYDIPYICRILKNNTDELIYKTVTDSQT